MIVLVSFKMVKVNASDEPYQCQFICLLGALLFYLKCTAKDIVSDKQGAFYSTFFIPMYVHHDLYNLKAPSLSLAFI